MENANPAVVRPGTFGPLDADATRSGRFTIGPASMPPLGGQYHAAVSPSSERRSGRFRARGRQERSRRPSWHAGRPGGERGGMGEGGSGTHGRRVRYDPLAMPASVHDNVLVSYEVLCEERKIVLHTEFRERKPPEQTRVVFTGVVAYRFENDTLGSILFDIETVPVGDLLQERRAEIQEAARFTAWPWAEDLDAAPRLLAEKGVKGFVLSSSYGMTGWVLAQMAAMGSTSEIVISKTPDRPGVYALSSDGARTWLDATGVVVAFRDGRELVVSLSSHPASRAGVMLRSEYSGAGQRAKEDGASREIYTAITLHPGGGNVMRAVVTARRGKTGEVVAGDSEGDEAPAKSYLL